MIGRRRFRPLVSLALDRLRPDWLIEDDDYPTDLLASVLRVDTAFWERSPDSDMNYKKWLWALAND